MRVLVVDDEVELAEAVAEGLELEGFTVDLAHDGHDALWRATEGSYTAIVLDVVLPGIDGTTVCRRLRERGVWTPVLMLTVRSSRHDERDALDLGADDYVTKPFALDVLVARLRALARRPSPPGVAPLTVGDLALDVARMRCSRGAVDVPLSPREFALLHALVQRAEQVVGRQELRDRVWGWDFEGNPGILDVYIGYLRDKIDRPFGTRSIETVRGVGYRIGAGR